MFFCYYYCSIPGILMSLSSTNYNGVCEFPLTTKSQKKSPNKKKYNI